MTDPAAARDKRWIALILLCSAQFVVVLDASIVNVALPTIGEALKFTESSLPWVVNAYVLTFGGFLLLGGRLADLLGRRRVFMFGLVLFALASLAGGLASNFRAADRRPRRAGAGRRDPLPRRPLDRRHHLQRRRRAQQSAGDLGRGRGLRRRRRRPPRRRPHRIPRLGMGAVGERADRDRRRGARPEPDRRDPTPSRRSATSTSPARSTITLGLSALVFALLDAEDAGWGSAQTIGVLAAAAILLVAFVAIERRSRAPLVPFSIFRIRTITGANVVGILVGASLFSMFFFISLYMQQVLGYSAIKAGLSYLPLAVAIMLSAGIASGLVTKVGFKPILAARHGLHRDRARLVHPDLRRRHLPRRHPRPLAASPPSASASPSSR